MSPPQAAMEGSVSSRNVVERFFNRIKHFRRVSTRDDKVADSYLVLASLACALGPFVNM
jgi:transposase